MTRQLRSNQIEVPPGMIDFGVGQPGLSTLPRSVIQQAAAHRLAQPDSLYLNYGPEEGDRQFLELLAQFLSDGYADSVSPLSLMVTGGASQALDLIVANFAQPGDTIFVEEPTYFLAPRIFRDRGLKVIGIPTDQDGLRIDALEEALREHDPKFIYTIPVHHNPSGVTLSTARRQQLVDLSVAHGFYILADEVYQMLTYSGTSPKPFASMLDSETIFSVGSFSKILGPGMRLGWVQAGPKLLDQLLEIGFVFSGGSLNQFSSQIVRSALELGLQQQFLETLKESYRERCAVLCGALREHLGDVVTLRDPTGGFFVWGEFAEGVDTAALIPAAMEQNVRFQPGVNFSSGDGLRNYMRFCFAHYKAADLLEGVKRLARIF